MKFAFACFLSFVSLVGSEAHAGPVDVQTDDDDAHADYVAVSTGGSAYSGGITVAGEEDSHGGVLSLSVYGNACDGVVNVSVFGGAGVC